MKYELEHRKWGSYFRKLREDHIDMLYELYKEYGTSPWRSDAKQLYENRSKKQYFIERMSWTFSFIEAHSLTKKEKKSLKPYQKQMSHYKITPLGLKIMVQLGYDLEDKDVAAAAMVILTEK